MNNYKNVDINKNNYKHGNKNNKMIVKNVMMNKHFNILDIFLHLKKKLTLRIFALV